MKTILNLNTQQVKNEATDYVFITLGIILYAFAFTFFILPYKFGYGGVTGAAAIVFYATGIPVQDTYLVLNLILLGVGLKVLGWRFLMKTIYAIFFLSFMLWVAGSVLPKDDSGEYIMILGEQQAFMSLLIGCMFTGTALAIVFLHNGSTGGTDIIAASVNKYYNLSIGQVLIIVDLCIIGSCLFIPQFGEMMNRLHMVIFGLCTIAVENFALDYVMNAQRESVQFLIFSKKFKEIAYAIGTQMDHGVTILDGHGWYTGQDMKVLCILARKRESVNIFRLIKIIDPNAFVSQSSVVGVYGEGFDEMKVKIKDQHQNENEELTRKAEEFYARVMSKNQALKQSQSAQAPSQPAEAQAQPLSDQQHDVQQPQSQPADSDAKE
jgi:uncharacterized membrane-anchored protein YitT (DUF2179 family)